MTLKLPKFPSWNASKAEVFKGVEDLLTEANNVWLDAERMFDEFEQQFPLGVRHSNFPPRNIVKTDTGYELAFAVAGFKRDDLSVEVDSNNVLKVAGDKPVRPGTQDADYLFRGIATRQFENRMQLLDGDKVKNVKFADGILSIVIERTPAVEPTTTKLTIE